MVGGKADFEGVMDLEFHQLDLRYEGLRARRAEAERALVGSLSQKGQQVPIVVVAANEAGLYVVIDGFCRIRGLRRLGQDTVAATLWSLSEAEALLLDRAQRQSTSPSALEQGWLLHELSERHGLRGEELAARVGRSASWVSRHLGLVREIPAAVQEHVRAGRLAAQAAMKHLLPVYRLRREDGDALVAAAVRLHLSSRDVGELCGAWLTGREPLRSRLVSEPELFLRSRRELAGPDPRPEAVGVRLTRDLDLAGVLLRRCARLLRDEGASLSDEERSRLAALGADTVADLGRVQRLLQQHEEVTKSHAESESTHNDTDAVVAGDQPAGDREEPETLAQDRPASDPLGLRRGAARGAIEPLRGAPRSGLGAVCVVQGESRAGP